MKAPADLPGNWHQCANALFCRSFNEAPADLPGNFGNLQAALRAVIDSASTRPRQICRGISKGGMVRGISWYCFNDGPGRSAGIRTGQRSTDSRFNEAPADLPGNSKIDARGPMLMGIAGFNEAPADLPGNCRSVCRSVTRGLRRFNEAPADLPGNWQLRDRCSNGKSTLQ